MNLTFATSERTLDILMGALFCLLTIAIPTATSDVARSRQYTAMVSSAACAADNPTMAIPMKKLGSVLRCASECTTKNDSCFVYQLDKSKGECQIFKFLPMNWTAIDGCNAFFNDTAVTNAVNASSVCSFPFTSDGQLYYQCAVNYSTTPYTVWCPKSNRQQVNCSTASFGYVAKNTTVEIAINTSASTSRLTLQSVAGWLTVLSRVDSNFPVGLDASFYVNGFGNIADNFWLGVENIHRLTNSAVTGGQTYRLRFEFLKAADNKWYSVEYDWFYLDGSASYTLRASSMSTGNAADCINAKYPSNNKAFVTYSSLCYSACGPWWYTDPIGYCSECRLLGNTVNGFYWNGYDLRIARMMMRAIN